MAGPSVLDTAEMSPAPRPAGAAPTSGIAEALRSFDGHRAQSFFASHVEIPVVAISAYLLLVYLGPRCMAHRPAWRLRTASQLWNLSVAAFSVCGALGTVPHLCRQLHARGLWYTACADAYALAGWGPPAFWAAAFTWSKLLELVDTLILIAKKRRLILLHWFHHASVIGFVWAAWIYETPLALWYGAMNFSVHSLMYAYFFAVSVDRRALKLAPLITGLQIAQFVWGTAINLLAAVAWSSAGVGCAVHPHFLQLGAGMYVAYGGLFMQLFVRRYVRRDRAQGEPPGSTRNGHHLLSNGHDAALKAV